MYSPYEQTQINFIYNLLFCDDLNLFRSSTEPQGVWAAILDARPGAAALARIAEDATEESRIRYLAYGQLRTLGVPVSSKVLLGVVVEVQLEGGLDVLAAFPDGRVRYINQTGKMTIFEPAPPEIALLIQQLIAAARPIVNQIGPWDQARLPPPSQGRVRITFLVSDGLYFGEGPYAALRQDAMAGPVLAAAEQLLQALVNQTIETPDDSLPA